MTIDVIPFSKTMTSSEFQHLDRKSYASKLKNAE